MNLLNKLTIKNLKLNKKRTIVTIIGIMLSVALITAVASMYASGIKSLIYYEINQFGDFHVSFYDVPNEEINKFEDNRSIDTVNIAKGIGYAKIDSQNEYKPYVYIKALTKKSLNNLSIRLASGRLPENDTEIVIPTHLKTNGRLDLKVGDTVTLDVGKRVDYTNNELTQDDAYQEDVGESIIETNHKTYKIVGIIERPANNIEPYSAPGYTFMTYLDENNISGNIDIYAKLTKDGLKNWFEVVGNIINIDANLLRKMYSGEICTKEEYDKFYEQMEKTYQIDINKYLIDLETNPLAGSSISGLGVVVAIVIGIIVFTSIFCIKNSFDISITEKIKQYGMLRSVGATKKQIKRNVFYEATILGLIGIPLGILLGCFATVMLVIVSNYFLSDESIGGLKLVLSISPLAILIAILLGIVTIYFSAFKSARRASKVSPIDSIRNSADIKIKSKKIKSPKFIKKIFGIGGEISYKNLKRNRKKYRTTVISIVVSVFVFIALSSFMSMAFDELEREVKLTDYNISLLGNVYDNEDRYNKYLATTKLENIDNYTVLRQMRYEVPDIKYNKDYLNWININGEDLVKDDSKTYIDVYVLGNYQYQKYIKSLGLKYDEIKNKAIIMDTSNVGVYNEKTKKTEYKTMRVYDYQLNEKLRGKIGDKDDYSIQIGYITDVKPFGLKDSYAQYLIISDDVFDSLLSGRVVEEVDIFYHATDANKLQDDIDELLKTETHYYLKNIEESVNASKKLITLVGIFLYGFIIVISLIGITNIFNTIMTNMELRKQEFAMLKSIGMTTKEFNRMIRLETLFMGVKSLFFGLPIGIVLSYVIYYFLAKESGAPYNLPIVAIIISMAVVFILISLIMKYSMNKINKQNTIETIRNENI